MAGKTYRKIRKYYTRKVLYPLLFNIHSLAPLKENKVVFLELRYPELSDSFRLIYKELKGKYNLDIHCHYLHIGTLSRDEVHVKMMDFMRDAATAKYLIYSEGRDIQACIRKRKGQRILNTWHGAGAFKRFGLSREDKSSGSLEKSIERYPEHADYDIVTVSSPEVVWAFVEAMGKEKNPGCIRPLGLSRTDVFYKEEHKKKAFENLYNMVPEAKGKKIISYAPTFRGRITKASAPDKIDVKKFYEALGDEYILLIKHHPVVKNRPEIPQDCSEFAYDVTDTLPVEDLIFVSDIMISDYSSVIFEYSLLEKPMVFFAYDLDEYYDKRGFFYDYEEMTPGPICKTNEEMIEYIADIDQRFDKSIVHNFREKFMSACDGHATERIIAEFFEPSIEKYRK
ncbi:CDP-glycerol glycerophosphotransferase family protein [Butyrivibrio sp. INlla16]|uniref:CDP-glycerol glycerophosphotransferase family protein n=1 Tax=Butyrivibrio sp. INlla16 TaxID=1520807 RepID=UPI0008915AF0|nr:CDP-glycerol glycerophosphotransferase family protein [Butyrivibrio sp. INlla16]SDB47739.1 CDP-glycerol glycerophosphotransferase, TagB/SpsB family [Butyrivibrio sp. INlla16]